MTLLKKGRQSNPVEQCVFFVWYLLTSGLDMGTISVKKTPNIIGKSIIYKRVISKKTLFYLVCFGRGTGLRVIEPPTP